ncbi:hypothetical protein [Streptomyces sp. AK02-01A]|uniref:hypothetical protein n=1 Tax=Streptomyces sp. AK02-01A TaxID=3028648 RepID=UPI0029A8E5F9|nr:hypothetical protein [Streptomyces sp. AK02-01A]MDX3855222.1 hypothetical protein [Streptomyces sp. AK02-01A]
MSVEHASTWIIGGYARGDTDIAADEVWPLEAHPSMTFAPQTAGLPARGLIRALGIGVVIARRGAYSVLRVHR